MSSTYETMWLFSRMNWLASRYQEGNFAPLGMVSDFPADLLTPSGWRPTDGSWLRRDNYRAYSSMISPMNNLAATTNCLLFLEDGTTPFVGNLETNGNYFYDSGTPGSFFVKMTNTSWKRVTVPDATANTTLLAVSSNVQDTTTETVGVVVLETGTPNTLKFHTYLNGAWVTKDYSALNVAAPAAVGNFGYSPQPTDIRWIDGNKDLWKWNPQTGDPVRYSDSIPFWATVKALYGVFLPGTPFLRKTNFNGTEYVDIVGDEGVVLFNVTEEDTRAKLTVFTNSGGYRAWGDNAPIDTVLMRDSNSVLGYWSSRTDLNSSSSTFHITPEYSASVMTWGSLPIRAHRMSPSLNPLVGGTTDGTIGFVQSYMVNAYASLQVWAAMATIRLQTGTNQWGESIFSNEPRVLFTMDQRAWWITPPTAFTENPKGLCTYVDQDTDYFQHYAVLNKANSEASDTVVLMAFQKLDEFKLPTATAPTGFQRLILLDSGMFPSFTLSSGGGGGPMS